MENENKFVWDKSKIDTSDIYDMEYWSFIWGIPKSQILEAVKETNTDKVEVLEQYLLQKTSKN